MFMSPENNLTKLGNINLMDTLFYSEWPFVLTYFVRVFEILLWSLQYVIKLSTTLQPVNVLSVFVEAFLIV